MKLKQGMKSPTIIKDATKAPFVPSPLSSPPSTPTPTPPTPNPHLTTHHHLSPSPHHRRHDDIPSHPKPHPHLPRPKMAFRAHPATKKPPHATHTNPTATSTSKTEMDTTPSPTPHQYPNPHLPPQIPAYLVTHTRLPLSKSTDPSPRLHALEHAVRCDDGWLRRMGALGCVVYSGVYELSMDVRSAVSLLRQGDTKGEGALRVSRV